MEIWRKLKVLISTTILSDVLTYEYAIEWLCKTCKNVDYIRPKSKANLSGCIVMSSYARLFDLSLFLMLYSPDRCQHEFADSTSWKCEIRQRSFLLWIKTEFRIFEIIYFIVHVKLSCQFYFTTLDFVFSPLLQESLTTTHRLHVAFLETVIIWVLCKLQAIVRQKKK